MKKTDDIKKWDYDIIYDDTAQIFSKFNECYEKSRELARYYIYRHPLYSSRIVVFKKDNVQIIKQERIKYGVSISFKKYKSSKEEYKFYFDTKNGSITKSKNGKFIQCKPSEIPLKIRDYIKSQKKWMSFIFDLNLPVTFNTIVTKKLYSTRKLLSWFYGCTYKVALNINALYEEKFVLRDNIKNIINIDNINPEFFKNQYHRKLFIEVLFLSIKTVKKINAVWSFKRLQRELILLNKHILNVIDKNVDEELKIHDYYLPIIKTLKDNNYYLIKTSKEIIKYCKTEARFYYFIDKTERYLYVVKDNEIYNIYWTTDYIGNNKNMTSKITFRFESDPSNNTTNNELKQILQNISKNYDNLVLAYNRKNKMKQLIINIESYEDDKEKYFDLTNL